MSSASLKRLALVIGWKVVNDDDGFTNYEYVSKIDKNQTISHLVRIYDVMNEEEFSDAVKILISVLPKNLRKKMWKLSHGAKQGVIADVIEVLTFTVEEFRSKTDYTKLETYAKLLGEDLHALGYDFEYELPQKKLKEILAIVETKIPIEFAPQVGKLKKLDYKISFVSNEKNFPKKA